MTDAVVRRLKELIESQTEDMLLRGAVLDGFEVLEVGYEDTPRKSRVVNLHVLHEDTGRVFQWEFEEYMSNQHHGDFREYPWDFDMDWEPIEKVMYSDQDGVLRFKEFGMG